MAISTIIIVLLILFIIYQVYKIHGLTTTIRHMHETLRQMREALITSCDAINKARTALLLYKVAPIIESRAPHLYYMVQIDPSTCMAYLTIKNDAGTYYTMYFLNNDEVGDAEMKELALIMDKLS